MSPEPERWEVNPSNFQMEHYLMEKQAEATADDIDGIGATETESVALLREFTFSGDQ